jgi:RHS repeat-associated protein
MVACKYTGAACSGSGFTTYSYDANGNLTGSSAGFSASYNALNQLTTGSNTYADSGQTLRIASGTKHFTYSLLGTAAESTGSSTTNYLHNSDGTLLGMATGTGASSKDYYILDGLGSVIGVTDSTGSLTRSYAYDPYGNSNGGTGSLSQPWQYASGYLDNTSPTSGFYKFGTRYYDPANMRWTQLDPKLGTLDDPMSQNGYLYVNGDPTNAVDSSGAITTEQILLAGEIVAESGAGCAEGGIALTEFGVPGEILGCIAGASGLVDISVASYYIQTSIESWF